MYSQESQKSHEFLILSNVKNIVYSVLEKRKPISTSYLSPDAQHSLITCYTDSEIQDLWVQLTHKQQKDVWIRR